MTIFPHLHAIRAAALAASLALASLPTTLAQVQELCAIQGLSGLCSIEPFVGAEAKNDPDANSCKKLAGAKYKGGACISGRLEGAILLTQAKDRRFGREGNDVMLLTVHDGKIAGPGTTFFPQGNYCVNFAQGWDYRKTDPNCVRLEATYGADILSKETSKRIVVGTFDPATLVLRQPQGAAANPKASDQSGAPALGSGSKDTQSVVKAAPATVPDKPGEVVGPGYGYCSDKDPFCKTAFTGTCDTELVAYCKKWVTTGTNLSLTSCMTTQRYNVLRAKQSDIDEMTRANKINMNNPSLPTGIRELHRLGIPVLDCLGTTSVRK